MGFCWFVVSDDGCVCRTPSPSGSPRSSPRPSPRPQTKREHGGSDSLLTANYNNKESSPSLIKSEGQGVSAVRSLLLFFIFFCGVLDFRVCFL